VTLSCLIVDDSEEFIASATRLLTAQGIRIVGRASSSEEAHRLVQTLAPDVALVDVELGAQDGIELAKRLSSDIPSTKVILISIRDRDEVAELMTGSAAVGFLRKDALDATAITDLAG
jgi:two-component system, NarL family, nitrate/nitrite response regulator NarL